MGLLRVRCLSLLQSAVPGVSTNAEREAIPIQLTESRDLSMLTWTTKAPEMLRVEGL
jgi:hypothetical protein